jgi:1-acyl-sn-glycerol-3-phosphate acyltransferase
MVLLVTAFLLASALAALLPAPSKTRRSARVLTTSFFSRLALVLLGIRIRVKRRDRLKKSREGTLIIANHVSYVDVLVLSALVPSVFITSVELKHTPLLGLLAASGGSLFVERRKPAGLKQEIDTIGRVLRQGFRVVLFPEGTTSNGDRVHPSLFDAAVSADAPLVPVCLRYTSIDNEPLSAANRDRLFYYGGVAFADHFPRLLSIRSITVEVTALRTVKPQDHPTRKELAAAAHAAICKAYKAA